MHHELSADAGAPRLPAGLAEKIAGVKRLIDAASTLGEAEAAAAAFQRPLRKHNPTEAEAATARGRTHDSAAYVLLRVRVAPSVTKGEPWRRALFHTLAHFGFCTAIFAGTGGNDLLVVGRPADIAAVQAVFWSLVPAAE